MKDEVEMGYYLLLALAIVSEIIATTCLKYSEGFTKILPSFACVAAYVICYIAFSKAITRIHLGVAYATWCGVGIVATALISLFIFKEKLTTAGIFGMICIVVGCVVLDLNGTGH